MNNILLVLSVMLFGCAQTPPPTSMNTTDWQNFGEEMARQKLRLHHRLMPICMRLTTKVMKSVKLSTVLKTQER